MGAGYKPLYRFLVPVLLLVGWHLTVVFGLWPRSIVATPEDALKTLVMRTMDGAIPLHAAISLMRLGVGFFVGSILGLCAGCLVSLSQRVRAIFRPSLVFLSLVPVVTWTPILILSLGLDGSKYALIALGAAGVVFSFTANAIAQTPRDLIDLARLHRKTTLETYRYIILPGAAYSILGGMRIAMALCWVLLISSELIASSSGLGWFIWDARNFSRPGDMVAGMIAVAILGASADALLAKLQRRLNLWQTTSSVVVID